jgi:hypothetical protein
MKKNSSTGTLRNQLLVAKEKLALKTISSTKVELFSTESSVPYELNLSSLAEKISHTDIPTKEFEFNISTPLNMQSSEVLKYDDYAFDRDSAYWESKQLIPLSSLELKYKFECDSLQKRYDDPKIQAKTDSAFKGSNLFFTAYPKRYVLLTTSFFNSF